MVRGIEFVVVYTPKSVWKTFDRDAVLVGHRDA
jgi:hypothetical protein